VVTEDTNSAECLEGDTLCLQVVFIPIYFESFIILIHYDSTYFKLGGNLKGEFIEDTIIWVNEKTEWIYNDPGLPCPPPSTSENYYKYSGVIIFSDSIEDGPSKGIFEISPDSIITPPQYPGISLSIYDYIPPLPLDSKLDVKSELNAIIISAYPNPFNPTTTISFPNPERNADIFIYDVRGREVFKRLGIKEQKLRWKAFGNSNGIYMLRIFSENKILKSKLILNK